MSPNLKPALTRSRGLILNEAALNLVDQAITKWYEEKYAPQSLLERKKLTLDDKGILLGMDARTIKRIYKRVPVDEVTLRTVFEKLNIDSGFSKEKHCVSASPPNLPTSCIGRETEVAEIKSLLQSRSLVTLTGTGGVGKTWLAIRVAAEIKHNFAAGVWFVDFAQVTNPALVPQTVAMTLGIQEIKDRSFSRAITNFLNEKSLLLILDNCEHLADACATLVHSLLSDSAGLRILATSRERLNISFEHPYRVPSLSLPDLNRLSDEKVDKQRIVQDSDAVCLFIERTRLHRPDFEVTNQNARMLASICHRLDGIPLAIELAAGRMDAMSLDDLECGLNDCFRVLIGGSKIPSRHETLQATMDWSYNLLNEKERTLLCRLSVFADGCRREAVEHICNREKINELELLDLLTSLVGKNLLVFQEQEGQARYHLLDTVRRYGRSQLAKSGEEEEVGRLHCNYFVTLAEEAELHLRGAEQGEWLQRLEAEHENLRAALHWSIAESEPPDALRLCGALSRFWWTHGHLSEGRDWCRQALEKPGFEIVIDEKAKTLFGAGTLACYQGDYDTAKTCLLECLNLQCISKNQQGIAASLNILGIIANDQGDYGSALDYYQQSLTLKREINDHRGMAISLRALGNVAYVQGDHETAHAWFKESLDIYELIQDQEGYANSLDDLGNVAYIRCEYAAARSYYHKSLSIRKRIGDRLGMAVSWYNLGEVAYSQKRFKPTRYYYKKSLITSRKMMDRKGMAYSLEAFAKLAAEEGKSELAAKFWGVATALRENISLPLPPNEREHYDRDVAVVLQNLGDKAYSLVWKEGYTMKLERAIELALQE